MNYEIIINGVAKEGDKIWLSDFILDNIEELDVNKSLEIFITRKS